MSKLRSRFLRFVRARKLMRAGDRVLVALSGGVDSVVLLHLLRYCAQQLRIEVNAAHFDHAMRADSTADAEWVAGLCQAWQVPLLRERTAQPIYGQAQARNERYRFLYDALTESGAQRIAMAHHADDQVETVLFRLLRGTGVRGLAGMPVRRGPLIRPLLPFDKHELLAYAAENHIGYRDDPTNEQLDYTRNRIRHTVIPVLETVRPDARSGIRTLARHAARTETLIQSAVARAERAAISAESNVAVELARPVLLEYHPELRAQVLRRVVRRFGVVPTRAHTRQIVDFCERAASGTELRLAAHVHVERVFDRMRIVRTAERGAEQGRVAVVGSAGRQRLTLGSTNFDVAWNIDDVRRPDAQHFDVALADAQLELRGWLPGDRIRLPYGSKKLKKLFAERRIPASQRKLIPVLADGRGRVLWVVGVARAVDTLPGETGPALNLTVTNAELR